MIRREDTVVIGKILKTHGINGEVVANIDYDISLSDLTCIVLDMDGILVPFFLNSLRQRSAESLLLKIDGINDEVQASEIVNHDIFAQKRELDLEDNDEDGFYATDLIGYGALNGDIHIGTVTDIDDSTENALFILEDNSGNPFYIPITEDFIVCIDDEAKTIEFDLPKGLLEMK